MLSYIEFNRGGRLSVVDALFHVNASRRGHTLRVWGAPQAFDFLLSLPLPEGGGTPTAQGSKSKSTGPVGPGPGPGPVSPRVGISSWNLVS